MIYLSKGGAGADSDHMWIRPCVLKEGGNTNKICENCFFDHFYPVTQIQPT